jgi:alkylhydroperoxidase family enzyme
MTNNRLDNGVSGLAHDVSREDSQDREALVLGDGPRVQPLGVAELTEDLVQMIERMMQVNSAIESRDQAMLTDVMSHQGDASGVALAKKIANLPEIMRTMLRHPDLFLRHTDTGIQLLTQGALSGRDRELAILRIAWLCQAPYEWGEHVHIAKKLGLTSADTERITRGSDAPGWSDHEQAILRATEELHKNAMISDATWAALSKHLDERQLIELPVLVGQYQGVAYYQNSLRLRLHDGNLGLKAR